MPVTSLRREVTPTAGRLPVANPPPVLPGQPSLDLAWQELVNGNSRFLSGEHCIPCRTPPAAPKSPTARNLSPWSSACSDSRVAAEIVFDQGLGDLFVVRTAGHVIDPGVLGSIEFGVAVLGIPLVVILGHDSCGAVSATVDAIETGILPAGYIRDIVERVTPSVLSAQRAGMSTADEIEAEHVRHTLRLLTERSRLIGDRVATGQLAVVGAVYNLGDGRARIVESVGLDPTR